jgi:type IV pilus assembly protein PilB
LTERLGELLIKRNYITPDQLKRASDEQKLKGGRLESNLVRLGYIKEDELLSFLSAQYRVPSVKISKMEINPTVIKLIPSSLSKKYFIIPINRMGPKLTLAMADPSNIVVIDEIKFMTGFNVEPVVASETEIIDAIKKYYGGGGNVAGLGSISFEAKDYDLNDAKDDALGDGISLDDDVVDVDDFDKLVHGAVDNVEVVDSQNLENSMDMEGPIIKIVNGILIKAIK